MIGIHKGDNHIFKDNSHILQPSQRFCFFSPNESLDIGYPRIAVTLQESENVSISFGRVVCLNPYSTIFGELFSTLCFFCPSLHPYFPPGSLNLHSTGKYVELPPCTTICALQLSHPLLHSVCPVSSHCLFMGSRVHAILALPILEIFKVDLFTQRLWFIETMYWVIKRLCF